MKHSTATLARRASTSHRIFTLSCLAASVAGVALGVRSWQRYSPDSGSPTATTLDAVPGQADGGAWVSITNATWYCDHPIRPLRGDSRQVVLWDGESSVVVVADFDANVQCSSLTPAHASGTVSRLDRESKYSKHLEENGLSVNAAAEVYVLCTYCGPRNDLLGVVSGVALTLIGLGLWSWAKFQRTQPSHR